MKKASSVILILLLGGFFIVSGASAQTVHQVAAGENTLLAAIEAAASGDIIELTDSGGLYAYNGSDKMYITKSLTIRAQAGLAERPIVRNVTPAAGSPRIFEIRKGGNLFLKGLNLDGRAVEGGAAFVKNIIRSEDVAARPIPFTLCSRWRIAGCTTPRSPCSRGHQLTIADSILSSAQTLFQRAYNEAIVLRESYDRGRPTSTIWQISRNLHLCQNWTRGPLRRMQQPDGAHQPLHVRLGLLSRKQDASSIPQGVTGCAN